MNYVGECGSGYQCGLCEGDCDGDSDCAGDLVCVQRNGFDVVAGCSGAGGDRDMYDKDICAPPPPTPLVTYVGNPCTDQFPSGKCEICTGDCDRDSDCADGLRCAQRRETSGIENVPGCEWGPGSDSIRFDNDDFCKLRTCLFVVCFEGFLVWVLSQRVCFFRLSARFHTRSCELCWRVWFRLPMRTL